MTDTDKLKRLAEDASFGSQRFVISEDVAKSILALIAENERLKSAATNMEAAFKDAVSECDKLTVERDEAVALLREIGVFSGDVDLVSDFLARIDAETQEK